MKSNAMHKSCKWTEPNFKGDQLSLFYVILCYVDAGKIINVYIKYGQHFQTARSVLCK